MAKLSEILGESFKQVPEDLKKKYKDIDLVDSSAYVTNEKYTSLETTKADIEGQLKTANKTIGELKKDNIDNENLQGKIDKYEKDYKKLKEDSENKIADMQFNYALEKALNKANVHNSKTVKALLNLDNVKLNGEDFIGLNEQLETLKESDSYLFKTKENSEEDEEVAGTGNIGGGTNTKTDNKSFGEILGEKRAKEMTSTKDIEYKFFN